MGETAYPSEVLRDLALLVVAVTLAWRPASRLALGRRLSEPDLEEYSGAR